MFNNPFGGGGAIGAAPSMFSKGNTMGSAGILGGTGAGTTATGGSFLGRQGGVDMSLAPLGMVSEKQILKAAKNTDRGRSAIGRGGLEGREATFDGLVGVRRAPTSQDFQSLLHESMGRFDKSGTNPPTEHASLRILGWCGEIAVPPVRVRDAPRAQGSLPRWGYALRGSHGSRTNGEWLL